MPRHTPRSRRMRRRHIQHTFSWRRPGARAVRLVAALLAVVCLAAFAMVTRPPTAHGSAAANMSRQFVGPEGIPDVARWQDEAQKTAFSIRLRAPAAASAKGSASQTGQTSFSAAIGNTYSFTLPSGDQIVGEVFPTRQPNGDFNVAGCQVARLVASRPQQVVATLNSHFDAHALVAFAQIGFVVASSVADPLSLPLSARRRLAIPLPCNLDVTRQAYALIRWRRPLLRCPSTRISSSQRIMPHPRRRLPGSRSMTPHPASYAGSIPTGSSLTPWRAPSRRPARLRRSRLSLRRLRCRQAQQARATSSRIAPSRSHSMARLRPAQSHPTISWKGGSGASGSLPKWIVRLRRSRRWKSSCPWGESAVWRLAARVGRWKTT